MICRLFIPATIKIKYSNVFSIFSGASYHHNNRRSTQGRHDRDRMERLEKERERGDKDRERERDRERIHARERDMLHYDINDEELLNERNYGTAADYNLEQRSNQRSHIPQHHSYHHRHIDENDVLMHERDRDRDRERDRYPPVNQPPQLTRRERDEYSPNRGGGNSRRILNAI